MSDLVRYNEACRAIAAAKAVDEAKDIGDKAAAMQAYARQAKNRELEIDAAEIRMRAERRLGELIRAQKETVGLRGPQHSRGGGSIGSKREPLPDAPPTLAEANIDKKLSARAQKLAAVPESKFEGMLGEWRERVQKENERVTTNLLKEGEIEQAREAYEERKEGGATAADLNALVAAGRRFPVIYADPPWEFRVYSGKGKMRSAERHYDTMSLDDIAALPVRDIAAPDCALFMWAVMPELPGALELLTAWGFTYKTVAFTWVKQNRSGEGLFTGMGYWTRANAELCLLATKGSPQRLAMDVHQVIMSPVRQHSRKPDEAAPRISRLLAGPYLELFAREPRDGWTTWGNEIERGDFEEAAE